MSIKNDSEKLVTAFEHMIEHVQEAMHDAEEALAPTAEEMVNNAQQMAHELYKLSHDESERLGKALRRDIQSANKVLNQQSKELKDWLSFDLELVEDKFIDLIAQAADKTWLDLYAFKDKTEQAGIYHSGEVCNAGKLICIKCSKTLKLSKASHIPPCAKCHGSEFHRVIK